MKQAATMTGPEFIQAQVRAQLQEALAEEAELDTVVPAPAQKHPTEVSPWLELTQWPCYLQGQSFTAMAILTVLLDPTQELLLVAFTGSVKRLIN
jgi:negative regulator of sigma E activity